VKNKVKLLILVSAAALLMPPFSYAQVSQSDIERSTKETLRPLRGGAEGRLKAKHQPAPAVKEDERKAEVSGKKYLIKKIKISGAKIVKPKQFASIISEYEGRQLSFADLEELSRRIQKEYLKKGIVATCVIEPQRMENQEVTLSVVEAKMGKLNVEGNKFFSNDRLLRKWQTRYREVLRYDDMLNSLDLMNRNPDRRVRARLSPGAEPETTDVTLVSQTRFPLHLTSTFDREGTYFTGRARTGLGAQCNNFLNLDDTLTGGYIFGDDFNTTYVYHSIPITPYGTVFNYGWNRSDATPRKEFASSDIRAHSENWSVSLSRDIIRKEGFSLYGYIGMDFNDKRTTTIDGLFEKDKLRIMRLGADIFTAISNGMLYVHPQFSQGLDILGATGETPYSSRGASSVFSKFNLDTKYSRPVFPIGNISIALKGQTAAEKLTPQEQFFLGGIDSVRGYPNGDYLADNAVQSNLEFSCPLFFLPAHWNIPFTAGPVRNNVSAVAFCDYGYGMKRGRIEGEKHSAHLVGIGGGLRIRLLNQFFVRLECGWPVGDRPVSEGSRGPRFHIAVDFEDAFLDPLARNLTRQPIK
jgi:hemolysin activation/secretion protein